MKIDPIIITYLNSNRTNKILSFIKLDKDKFEYSKLESSNAKNNKRLEKFKQETTQLLSNCEGVQITAFLSNLSILELILDKNAIKKLRSYPQIKAIEAIKEL